MLVRNACLMTVLVFAEKQIHEFVFEPFWTLQLSIKWLRTNKGFLRS